MFLSFFGYDWLISLTQNLKDWSALITIILLAVWYTLGIIVDRVADGLVALLLPNIKDHVLRSRWIRRKFQKGVRHGRMFILAREGKLFDYFDYLYSRTRIARTTLVNLVFIIFSLLIFIVTQCDKLGCTPKLHFTFATLGLGFLFTLATLVTMIVLDITGDFRLAEAKRELKAIKE